MDVIDEVPEEENLPKKVRKKPKKKSKFTEKKRIRKYKKRVYPAEKKFACDECGQKYYFLSKLKHHQMVHTGEKPYKCDTCGKAFNTHYSLRNHIRIHTGEKPYECSFCSYRCRDNSTLRKHQYRHMGIVKRYDCTSCDKTFCQKQTLKEHVAEVHLNVDIRNHSCDKCGKTFKSAEHVRRHIKDVHNGALKTTCPICKVVLSNKGNLATHLTVHTEHRPYVCNFMNCKKRYKTVSDLNKHAITHYPDKQLPCPVCGNLFTRKHRLQHHIATVHERTRRVECDYCGERFYSKNYLVSHMNKKHRQGKKYVCDMCGFKTYNKPSIVNHIRGHNNENDRECHICHTIYKRNVYLKMHYKKTHGMIYKRVHKVKTCAVSLDKLGKIIKTEPPDEDTSIDQIEVKQEPKDDEQSNENDNEHIDEETRAKTSKRSAEVKDMVAKLGLDNVPLKVFNDFCKGRVVLKPYVDKKEKEKPSAKTLKRIGTTDLKAKRAADKSLAKLMSEVRRKTTAEKLENARQIYNEKITNVYKTRAAYTKKEKIKDENKNSAAFDDEDNAETFEAEHKERNYIDDVDDSESIDTNNTEISRDDNWLSPMNSDEDIDTNDEDVFDEDEPSSDDENGGVTRNRNFTVKLNEQPNTSKTDNKQNILDELETQSQSDDVNVPLHDNGEHTPLADTEDVIRQNDVTNNTCEPDLPIQNKANNTSKSNSLIENEENNTSKPDCLLENEENNTTKPDSLIDNENNINTQKSDVANINDTPIIDKELKSTTLEHLSLLLKDVENYITKCDDVHKETLDNINLMHDYALNPKEVDEIKEENDDDEELSTVASAGENLESASDRLKHKLECRDSLVTIEVAKLEEKSSKLKPVKKVEKVIEPPVENSTIMYTYVQKERVRKQKLEIRDLGESDEDLPLVSYKDGDKKGKNKEDLNKTCKSKEFTDGENSEKGTGENVANNDTKFIETIAKEILNSVKELDVKQDTENTALKDKNSNDTQNNNEDKDETNQEVRIKRKRKFNTKYIDKDNFVIEDEIYNNIEEAILKEDEKSQSEVKDVIEKRRKSLGRKKRCQKLMKVNESSEDEAKKRKPGKMNFNSHQCYVCFKLFETKQKLIDHCQEHFDICTESVLMKCPLCDYVGRSGFSRHLRLMHKLKLKIPYSKLRDKKDNTDGSRYYYEIDDPVIKKMEVIPSVNNLNKMAMLKIDKKKREIENKTIAKPKLVKKGKEWIVEKEKINLDKDIIIPKINNETMKKLLDKNIKISDPDPYLDSLKKLYHVTKKEGKKILFPCQHCEKICQNFSALKLHSRKHEANPKPFAPKVWKHKLKEPLENTKKEKVTIKINHRTTKPQPIKNNHKCDPELLEFYEKNIRGGDIEFWQFLKIFNKMGRDNINDFEDLDGNYEYGIGHHVNKDNNDTNADDETININTKNQIKSSKNNTSNNKKITAEVNTTKNRIINNKKTDKKRKGLNKE